MTMRSSILLLCVALAAASSFPNALPSCDVDGSFGKGKTWMTWVEPAVRTDAFTVRSGDGCGSDPTTYIPGQFTSIHVRSHKYKGQFRGILLYATDASGNRVGDWQLDWPNSNMFYKPTQTACQNRSLMHLNGAEKYYHHEFKFVAPPAGTGKIEFHCLIKRGQANTGEFYHPNLNQNLILNEALSSPAGDVWVEGPKGSTCTQTCGLTSKTCDSKLLNNAFKWAGALHSDVLLSVGCASPALTSASATSISKDASGWCTYPSPLAANLAGACDAVPPVGSTPVCPCGSATVPSFGDAVPPPATACLNQFVMLGSASKPSSSVASLLMLIAGLFLHQHKRSNFVLSMACILFCAYTVQAHNWVYSVSRSFNQASTYKPCRPRVNDVPHWQINEGQNFTMEWATGHDFYFYYTVVNAKDIEKLENTTEDNLDDYLATCQTNKEFDYMAQDPVKWAKQHIDGNPNGMTDYRSTVGNGPIYSGNISQSDPKYIWRHPKFGTYNNEVRWVYLDQYTNKDRRCSYFNPKYPHIIAVHRFVQVETVKDRAGDRDIARFTINLSPGHEGYGSAAGYGSGQYILQYLWRGYFDCADVDLFPISIPVNSSLVGGRPIRPDEPQWNRVDHCQFEEIQGLQTGCFEVATTADRCLTDCIANMDCGGVNVVPMWLPKTVYPLFADRVGIPWDNTNSWRGCMQKDFADLTLDARVCYGLVPRLPNNTHASYSVTDDPEDPLFYATCFVKKPQWTFDLTLNNSGVSVAPVPPAWAFGGRCVECNEWKASQVSNVIPHWNLPAPENCVNCETAVLPPVPDFPGSSIARGSKCDGSYSDHTDWNYHNVSAACANKRCVKSLTLVNRNDIKPDECIAKARADPECSEFVQHQGNADLQWWQPAGCECFVKDSCCGTCVPADADFKNWEWNIYSTKPKTTGDPTCANGVRSSDNAYCCSASCKDANNVGVCMPVPGLQVSFQSLAMTAPDGWGVDNGLKFGPRNTSGYTSSISSSWGWNCDGLSVSATEDRETKDGTNYHSTYIRPDSAICKQGGQKDLPTWSVSVQNGDYQVDTLYTRPWTSIEGCHIQNTTNYDPGHKGLRDYDMAWVSRTVTADNGQISLSGGTDWPTCGGYAAVVIYPKSSVPSNTYCQSLPGMCCPLFIDMENRPCSMYEAPCKM